MALWTCSWALHPPILLRRQAQAAAVAGWQRVRWQPLHTCTTSTSTNTAATTTSAAGDAA